jgi:hypothetical protein
MILTADVAEKLADGSIPCTDTDRFTQITDDAALVIQRFYKGPYLDLNGIASISSAAAECLGRWSGTLYANGLQTITVDAARGLALNTGKLLLGNVKHITDEAAAALSKHAGSWLQLGLTSVSARAGASLANWQGDWLSLPRLQVLDAPAAEALSGFDGTLYVPSLRTLDGGVAAALGRKRLGQLILKDNRVTVWTGSMLEELETTELTLSPEIAAGLCCSPAFNPRDYPGSEALASKTLEDPVLKPREYKSVREYLAVATKATDAGGPCDFDAFVLSETAAKQVEALKSALDMMDSLGGAEGDLDSLFSAACITKLLKTMNPYVWRVMAARFAEHPLLFARLCRCARDIVQSKKRSDGHFETCVDFMIASDDRALAAVLMFVLDQDVPFALCCEYDPLGGQGITAVMAEAIARYSGKMVLLNTDLPASVAEALSRSVQLLSLPKLRSLSEEAASQLANHRGWLEVNLSRLSPAAAQVLRQSSVRFAIRPGLPCQRCGGDVTSCRC